MAIQNVSLTAASAAAYQAPAKEKTESTEASEKKDVYGDAAVYEKSTDAAADTAGTKKSDKTDRSALIAQLKADQEAQTAKLMEIVKKTISGQGAAIGTADDMWKFLASGDFTVDAATKAQAQKDISEDGYWGVKQTSDRILDFAKALTGSDPDQADAMLEAVKKGFKEATKSWGKDLPDISQKTYDAVVEKFNAWKKEGTKTTDSTSASSSDGTVKEKDSGKTTDIA